MIAVVVVNYRQPRLTLECLASLYAKAGAPFHVYLIDNAPDAESRRTLADIAATRDNLTLVTNDDNKGFAGACNQALDAVLADARFEGAALLNNDTLVQDDWLARMARRLDPSRGITMVAGRMMEFEHPERVDSLGIVLYKSGIASNRKDMAEPLLGPCGGAALYGVELLRAVKTASGHLFDPDFFCYAEDTDLALRARALGFQCAYADDAVVRHRGRASSGGGFNELVAYYGLRNSLFALVKNLPADLLIRDLGWILLMQLAVVLKYLIKGKPRLVWRIYRDFGRGLARALRQRQAFKTYLGGNRINWRPLISRRFYDLAYIAEGIRHLHRRDIRAART